ncbi:D-alanine--D-alanine ligase family protein [Actinomycetospora sp. NBRC 106378]|uniref:D-alanine--D-alanine ligase family protein n=1 Tax=Actinomycetospora sp. NBRC 106378 TaxID=3032208 RepID=UPI0024A555BF|nr:D-alanine--D-alanine ligase family protein [Actinomycetospora sp. NBRC 106378]GLZ53640.1 D-alanine--D-alanine ligase [Actinomycetospora sp. NBRC 106378]
MGAGARPTLLVLFGGRSGEHAVSCVSAGGILDNLDRERFDVVPVGITPEGVWLAVGDDTSPWRLHGREMPRVTLASGEPVALLPDPTRRELISLAEGRRGETVATVDVVFPVLHGPAGEDGEVQGLLETAGIPYVGAGVCASAASMDKVVTKRILRDAGLATGDAVALDRTAADLEPADRERLGLPVFVKPSRAGSSVGISRVTAWEDVPAAVAVARESDPKVIVEAGIAGREIECGVLQFPDGRVEASVPAEIRLTGDADWYDFDTKYLDDACELDVPAKLDDDLAELVRDQAVRVFRTMDCAGLARVDFFVTEDGRVLVNELNTMPGFTATSLYPRMWATTGVDYPTLLTTLVDSALAGGTGVR